LLGEAFKLNLGFAKLSFSLLVFGMTVLLAINKSLRIYLRFLDKLVYLYGILFLVYTLVGIVAGNTLGDVFEDLYPILVFVILFTVWRSFDVATIAKLWRVILVMSVLAAGKVLLLAVLPYEALWDNNWQAMKEPIPFTSFARIVLRGGDIFLSFGLIYFILTVLRKVKTALVRNVLLICLFALVVFISLSRSSYLAIGVALVLTFLLFKSYFATKKLLFVSCGLLIVLVALLPFFNTIALAASIFEARTDAFDANDVAVEFRKDERSLIFDKASSVYYAGNGLGSYVYVDLSGSTKKDDRSIYAHDFNAWLIFKTGVPGLLLFYAIFINSCYNLFWCLRQKANLLNRQYHLLLLSLFASGISVYVVSFLANKLSTLSGCVFFAFYAASSIIMKRKYESSN
jgi:O-antigen ligase